jgi:hypothetical protein
MTLQTEKFPTNPFVQHIQEGAPESLIEPADFIKAFISRTEKSKQIELQGYEKAIQMVCEEYKIPYENVEQQLQLIEKTYNSCLPCEKKALSGPFKRLKSRVSNKDNFAKDIDNLIRRAEETIVDVKSKFPGVEILDLSSLYLFTLANGLPRLGLLNVEDAEAKIGLTLEYVSGDKSGRPSAIYNGVTQDNLDKIIQKNLIETVQAATGMDVVEKNSIGNYCTKIKLNGEFKEPILTSDVRDIINKARNSKIFDAVVLLTEVTNWRLDYYYNYNNIAALPKPKIPGTMIAIPPRQDKDPLILGLKNIDSYIEEEPGRSAERSSSTIAFLLGAFDTTSLEDWIKCEMATPA